MKGKVFYTRIDRGYMLIKDDEGQVYFAHVSETEREVWDSLMRDDRVEFVAGSNAKGKTAARLRKVTS